MLPIIFRFEASLLRMNRINKQAISKVADYSTLPKKSPPWLQVVETTLLVVTQGTIAVAAEVLLLGCYWHYFHLVSEQSISTSRNKFTLNEKSAKLAPFFSLLTFLLGSGSVDRGLLFHRITSLLVRQKTQAAYPCPLDIALVDPGLRQ